jgi:predicted AAA+ superfamily ATPase
MALTNHDRISKALELLNAGLKPFVERELKSTLQQDWFTEVKRELAGSQLQLLGTQQKPQWDVAALLATLWNQWNTVFRKTLGQAERTLVSELRDVRNRWAHQRPFSTDDAYRSMDSMSRLLAAVSAPEADEVEKMKMELLRLRFDEQVRSEKRKSASTALEGQATGNLKPWREVITPHSDVAKGSFQNAEFAADLWQVYQNQGSDEYRDPVEFFRRTFLTQSLSELLVGAIRRLGGQGGDPVVQLQTNFGGGKTHSMLALFHLFSGRAHAELPGLEPVVNKAGVTGPLSVRRAVLVGNKLSPGNPQVKPDGTEVRTLWGELAWQLGGREGYKLIAKDDELATSPGDRLRELFDKYGPCLILVDEWVAYARQLHDSKDLPGGDFETHFTFAQTLTEAAKNAKHTLLVVSLPASEAGSVSPHSTDEDIEVGGVRGREALARLQHALGRVESNWRPANQDEGFEIVRRRLFSPMVEQAQFLARDTTVSAFAELYRTQHTEFPPECRESDYERRMKLAYPIHPEVFDRLYSDWGSLVKFQRTRGVLRLMAAVIHALWEKGDRNPMILPAHLPIDEPRVQFELTRYLPDQWTPVIEKDVDGPNSLPLRMDAEQPNLGKYSACRRVARTIYLGSAPTTKAANRGMEDRRMKLGCVMPGESPAIFGDALRRLSAAATFLYHDGARYWYSTQPTVTKLAEDRAEQLKSDPDSVVAEMRRRVQQDVKQARGDFARVHDFPGTGADVADEPHARLVILGIEYPHSKDGSSSALVAAKAILDSKGNSPRLNRNALVFLASDKTRVADLDEAVRRYLAWKSILDDATELVMDPIQVKQAKTQFDTADKTVTARLPECFQWLLVPTQTAPEKEMEWETFRLSGSEALCQRVSKKLRNDELLITGWAGTGLRRELDKVPLWRGDSVAIKQLVEDFARYTYLPRLRDPSVLLNAIREGLGLLVWQHESFAFAESYDEASGRYLGLRGGQNIGVSEDSLFGLLVKPEVALKQMEADKPAPVVPTSGSTATAGNLAATTSTISTHPAPAKPAEAPKPKRFHGSVTLDPQRVGRDAGKIAEEVIAHIASLIGADVTVRLDIEAIVPTGVPDNVVRTVTENARTLKFTSQGFEVE